MNFTDSLLYFALNFFLYGFIGWIFENAFCYAIRGHFQKDGFLNGPFKPMYAIAMSLLIFLSYKVNMNTYLLIPMCIIIPTTVEYITGVIMRTYFHKDYWDYSMLKYNFQGIICLEFSIAWTVLTFIGVKYLQVYVINDLYKALYPSWLIMCSILLVVLIVDEILTLKEFRSKGKVVHN